MYFIMYVCMFRFGMTFSYADAFNCLLSTPHLANDSWFTASLDDNSEVKGQVVYSSRGGVRVR